MSVVGPLLDTLLQRVRDPHAIGTSRDLARSLLAQAQRLLNTKDKLVLETVTLDTQARRLIYPIHDLLPTSARVVCVRDDSGNDLDYEMNWHDLSNFKSSWFRDVAPQHKIWSIIGRDLLVVYPARDIDSTVSVVSAKLTDTFNDDSSETEIPESDEPALLDIAELLVSIRNRNLPVAQDLLKALQARNSREQS